MKYEKRISTLAVTVASCWLGPLLAHFLEVCCHTQEWPTDKIYILFFSMLSSGIIWQFLCENWAFLSRKYEKLGENFKDLCFLFAGVLPGPMLLGYYNRMSFVFVDLLIFIATIILLTRRNSYSFKIKNLWNYFVIALALILSQVCHVCDISYNAENTPVRYFVVAVLAAFVFSAIVFKLNEFIFDVIMRLYNKIKKHRNKGKK